MSDVTKLQDDALVLLGEAKEFVAEFFYAPIGIEASETLVNGTLYGLGFLGLFVIYRLSRPAPVSRYRKDNYGAIDYGRNV